MTKNSKQTSKAVASKASRILRNGHYEKNLNPLPEVLWHRQNREEGNNVIVQ